MKRPNIRYLLKEREEFYNKDVDNISFDKINGNIEGGKIIEIYWKNYDYPDIGYLFELPFNSPDEGDIFCHIPQPQTFDKGDADPIWCHIGVLLDNDLMEKIIVKNNPR